jgi:hypothetical protein
MDISNFELHASLNQFHVLPFKQRQNYQATSKHDITYSIRDMEMGNEMWLNLPTSLGGCVHVSQDVEWIAQLAVG